MSQIVRRFILAAMLFGLAIVLSGCGGRKVVERVKDPEDTDSGQLAAAKMLPTPAAAAKPAAKAAATRSSADKAAEAARIAARPAAERAAPATTAVKPGAKPKRPADLANWQPEDFFSARTEKDVKLIAAISHLGKTAGDRNEAARLLVRLLQADPIVNEVKTDGEEPQLPVEKEIDIFAPPLTVIAAKPPADPLPGYTAAVVTTLGNNGCATARRAIKQILLGKLNTICSDKTLTLAAVKSLADNIDTENQALLLALLINPDAVRPVGRGDVTADELQAEAVKFAQSLVTSDVAQFRAKIAQHVIKETTPRGQRLRLMPMLLPPELVNLPAQSILVSSGQLEPATRAPLCRLLADYSRQAIDRLLKLPPTRTTTAANQRVPPGTVNGIANPNATAESPVITSSRAAAVVRYLWNREFAASVIRQMNQSPDLTKEPELLCLAMSLPDDRSRRAVTELLHNHWHETAAFQNWTGLQVEMIRDPATLLAFKNVPRGVVEEPLTKVVKGPRLPPGTVTAGEDRSRGSAEQQARKAWLQATESFVRSLNKRCYAATLLPEAGSEVRDERQQTVDNVDDLTALALRNSQPSDKPNSSTEAGRAAGEPPVALSPGARVVASYQMSWPRQLPDSLISTNVCPLEINYFRIETEDIGNKLTSYYVRQLKGASNWPIENGRWVDFYGVTEEGRLRSVDVMISRAEKTAPTAKTVTEKLNIELLWIETRDTTH